MNQGRQGKVVTFYSYKGGTGRTMALANIAWILAANGKRVLAADWDLESPGLHRFFHPFLNSAAISSTPGIIDMIRAFALEAMDLWAHRPLDWHREYVRVLRYAVSLEWEFPGDGALDFLSAGMQNRDYSASVASLDWDNFYERLNGWQFFDALRENMQGEYDYTLIDSRTGLSDVADICTVQLPDTLVTCFTLSDQSIEGAAAMAREIEQQYANRGIRILPLPTRIDEGEKERADAGRALARLRFEGLPSRMTDQERTVYWGTVEVPYRPFYAYEEILATFGDRPGVPTSLLSRFEALASYITDGAVTALPDLPDAERQRVLDLFARRMPRRAVEAGP
jgi:cellulose biosynthesis protein BcsQ